MGALGSPSGPAGGMLCPGTTCPPLAHHVQVGFAGCSLQNSLPLSFYDKVDLSVETVGSQAGPSGWRGREAGREAEGHREGDPGPGADGSVPGEGGRNSGAWPTGSAAPTREAGAQVLAPHAGHCYPHPQDFPGRCSWGEGVGGHFVCATVWNGPVPQSPGHRV